MTVDWMRRMREARLTQDQIEAIASWPEDRYVTRDYLDSKLSALEASLVKWILGVATASIAIMALIDKFVRP